MASFYIQTRLFFGPDRNASLSAFLKKGSYGKVAFVVDAALASHPMIAQLNATYTEWGYTVSVLTHAQNQEPSYDDLDLLTDKVRPLSPDLLVGIGGGSILDLVKGVGILLKNPGKGIAYRGMDKVQTPGVPMIAYPTTAGTGSEVTWTASFIDRVENKKLGINGQFVAPLCGVLEPAFIVSCPRSVLISAGLDAMLHAIEAVTAKTATYFTQSVGTQAFATLFHALPHALSEDAVRKEKACEDLLIGAYWAGVSMMNAGGGPASGVSYPVGVHFNVPHGFAGGVLLPYVFEKNVEKGYLGYAPVFDVLFPNNGLGSDQEKSKAFVDKVMELYQQLNAPLTFAPWHCTGPEAKAKLHQLTLEQRMENLNLNPVSFDATDLTWLLDKVC